MKWEDETLQPRQRQMALAPGCGLTVTSGAITLDPGNTSSNRGGKMMQR